MRGDRQSPVVMLGIHHLTCCRRRTIPDHALDRIGWFPLRGPKAPRPWNTGETLIRAGILVSGDRVARHQMHASRDQWAMSRIACA